MQCLCYLSQRLAHGMWAELSIGFGLAAQTQCQTYVAMGGTWSRMSMSACQQPGSQRLMLINLHVADTDSQQLGKC